MSAPLPDPSTSRAVLIGVADYSPTSGLPDLPAVTHNLDDLRHVLCDARWWGLPAEHCTVLRNPARAQDVAVSLGRTGRVATDTLLVYFAGHGLVDAAGRLVLGLGDTDSEWRQFTGLRYEWVREALMECRARRKILVIDSCFSGRAIDSMTDVGSTVAGQLDIAGTYVLTATTANALARAPQGTRHTAFSGELIRILRGGDADSAETLSLTDIYELLCRAMIRSGFPLPLQMGTQLIGRLPLVRNAAWPAAGRGTPTSTGSTPQWQPAAAHVGVARPGVDLALIIRRHDQLPPTRQVDFRLAFSDAVGAALRESNADVGALKRRPHGHGEVITVPSGSGDESLIVTTLRALARNIAAHNRDLPRDDRLRVTAFVGPEDTSGQTRALASLPALPAFPAAVERSELVALLPGWMTAEVEYQIQDQDRRTPLFRPLDDGDRVLWQP